MRRNRKFLFVCMSTVLSIVSVQSVAQIEQDRGLRMQIMKDCGVQAWQFSITTPSYGPVRYQMSPTLPADTKACILSQVDPAKAAKNLSNSDAGSVRAVKRLESNGN